MPRVLDSIMRELVAFRESKADAISRVNVQARRVAQSKTLVKKAWRNFANVTAATTWSSG